MKQQKYSFQSQWNIQAARTEIWDILTAVPFSWQEWWPQLSNVHNMQLVDGLTGTTFSCRWRSPSGYHLDSNVTIGKIIPLQRVVLQSIGDLLGTVDCHISEVAGSTKIDITWEVTTTKPWMNYLAPLLKPFFVYSHHAVMRSGERGLQQYTKQQNNT